MKFLERIANKPSSVTIDYIPKRCAFCNSERILRSEPSHLDKRHKVKLRFFCRSCMIDMFVVDAKAAKTKTASTPRFNPPGQNAQIQNKILRSRLQNATEKLAAARRALRIQNARREKDLARIDVLEQLVKAHSADKAQLVSLQAKLVEAAQEIKEKDVALTRANKETQFVKSRNARNNLIQLPTPDPERISRMRHIEASMDMAKRIERGLSLTKPNAPKQAVPATAEQKYARAVRYMKGDGVAINHRLAVTYFEQAANFGHIKAQYNIGVCRARGTGGKKDVQEAYRWLLKAAEQGHKRARTLLPEIAEMLRNKKPTVIAEL